MDSSVLSLCTAGYGEGYHGNGRTTIQMFPMDQTWVLWRDLDLGDPKRYPVQEVSLTEGWTVVSQELEGLPGWKGPNQENKDGEGFSVDMCYIERSSMSIE